jgi:hypothetical protein
MIKAVNEAIIDFVHTINKSCSSAIRASQQVSALQLRRLITGIADENGFGGGVMAASPDRDPLEIFEHSEVHRQTSGHDNFGLVGDEAVRRMITSSPRSR